MSRYIIRNKEAYCTKLLGVTKDGAWGPWILYMLDAVEDTAEWTLRTIGAIRELVRITQDHVRKELPRVYSRELVDLLLAQPYGRIGNIVEAGLAGRQAAARRLKELVAIDVLEESRVGRDKLFVNSRLRTLLTSETQEVRGF